MKTIEIHFPPTGPPTVTPDTQTCLSEETLVFVISSENVFMTSVNLAFDGVDDKVFSCPDDPQGERKHHCMLGLVGVGDPVSRKEGVLMGIALEHKGDVPLTLKYTISPYVLGNHYPEGEVDPYIIITKRPVTGAKS